MTKQEKIQRYKQLKEELETLTGKRIMLTEAAGIFKGMPSEFVKQIVRSGGGENSAMKSGGFGINNPKKISAALNDPKAIGVVGQSKSGQFGFLLMKENYAIGQANRVYVLYVAPDLVSAINQPETPVSSWGRVNVIDRQYYHRQRAMRPITRGMLGLNEALRLVPTGDFQLLVVYVDENRAELKQQRRDARSGSENSSGKVSEKVAREFFKKNLTNELNNKLKDVNSENQKLEQLLQTAKDFDAIRKQIDTLVSKYKALQDEVSRLTQFEDYLKRYLIGKSFSDLTQADSWTNREFKKIFK